MQTLSFYSSIQMRSHYDIEYISHLHHHVHCIPLQHPSKRHIYNNLLTTLHHLIQFPFQTHSFLLHTTIILQTIPVIYNSSLHLGSQLSFFTNCMTLPIYGPIEIIYAQSYIPYITTAAHIVKSVSYFPSTVRKPCTKMCLTYLAGLPLIGHYITRSLFHKFIVIIPPHLAKHISLAGRPFPKIVSTPHIKPPLPPPTPPSELFR